MTISTRIHAMENRLLSRERMERMISAQSESDAMKVLDECGYGSADGNAEGKLSGTQAALLDELQSAVPEPRLVDIFRLKYDYHNAKALVKAEAVGADARHLLVAGGRYDSRQLAEDFQRDGLSGTSVRFQQAVSAARRTLADTHDPQQSDVVLDKACYEEMTQLASDCASPFLKGYVRLCTDIANLRTAVRVARMGKGSEFLLQVLMPGGSVAERTLAATQPEDLAGLFQSGPLAKAAQLGSQAAQPESGSLLAFERECDNALTRYVAGAKRVPFGEEPVVAFLHAKEAELTAIRTILSGRRAGLSEDMIWERLRECYV